MGILDKIGGVVTRASKRLYRVVSEASQTIAKRTVRRLDGDVTPDLTRHDLTKLGITDFEQDGTPILPTRVEPFSEQISRDPRISGIRDLKTGRKLSREQMLIRLTGHMRRVQIMTIKQNRPDLSDREILALAKNFQGIAERRRELLREERFDDEFRNLDEQFGDLARETGLISP